MRRGDASIAMFPIIFSILIIAWVLMTSSLFDISRSSHGALAEFNARQKAAMEANLDITETPNPLFDSGTVKNAGETTLLDVDVVLVNDSLVFRDLANVLSKEEEASFSFSDVDYGNTLVVRSEEYYWAVNLIPYEQRADHASQVLFGGGGIVGSILFLKERFDIPPSEACLKAKDDSDTCTDDAALLAAVQTEGGTRYIINGKASGYILEVRSPPLTGPSDDCYDVVARVTVKANSTGNAEVGLRACRYIFSGSGETGRLIGCPVSAPSVDIPPLDTLTFSPGPPTKDESVNIAEDLKIDGDGNVFRIQLDTPTEPIEIDYVEIDLKCVRAR
jgi:hypothetical protein